MGITKHEAVIGLLALGDDDAIAAITALRDQSQVARQLLLGPAMYYNGVVSFVLLPDGANEGSPPSNEADKIRDAFLSILKKHSRHWAHIVLEDEAATPPTYRPQVAAASGYGRD
jgi:hypothetical protein